MLKKAGIITAGATAGLLALSPLAFAGDYGHKGHDGHDHGKGGSVSGDQVNVNDNDKTQNGLVNVGNIDALNNPNVAPAVNVNALTGALGLVGDANAKDTGGDATANSNSGNTQSNTK
ncbi:hypothetical protein [Pseudonocardia phyllosphaerae]|uniref:hypothetical protein n=1 Tax=Pseudonocardia phyllosphaerae TaxID=3390502 RepID=UPI003977F16B